MEVLEVSNRKILEPQESTSSRFSFKVDPYIGCEHGCHYCFVVNETTGGRFEKVFKHADFVNRLQREMAALEPQMIYLGADTDPYQPCEKTHLQTRRALQLFTERGFSACILTKSDLILRDIDLLANMPEPWAGLSIAFQDEDARELFEAITPSIKDRIEALRKLKEAGIETYTLVCPVMPFISDVERIVDMVAPYSDSIWFYRLDMKSEQDWSWRNVRSILKRSFPKLEQPYREIAFSSVHPYWEEIRLKLERIKQGREPDFVVHI